MAFVQFSGVTLHDPAQVYDSYVLYTAADGVTRLIDLDGVVRNEWPFPGVPARIIDPALNGGRVGDVGLQLTQLDGSPGGIYGNRTIGQLSWTGAKLWEWGTEGHRAAPRARTTTGSCWPTATDSSSSRSRAKYPSSARTSLEIRESTKSHRPESSRGSGGPAITSVSSVSPLRVSTTYAAQLRADPTTSGDISSSIAQRRSAPTAGTALTRGPSLRPTTF